MKSLQQHIEENLKFKINRDTAPINDELLEQVFNTNDDHIVYTNCEGLNNYNNLTLNTPNILEKIIRNSLGTNDINETLQFLNKLFTDIFNAYNNNVEVKQYTQSEESDNIEKEYKLINKKFEYSSIKYYIGPIYSYIKYDRNGRYIMKDWDMIIKSK